jgi:16S rRNA (adenine1518-N6/adenine1519-N6)-dimethyltransferase
MLSKDKYEKYRPKKFLGQNFLVDDNISQKIIKCLDIKENDIILEIGPGQGALTKFLIDYKNEYIAVEIDKHIVEKLNEKYYGKIKILHKDFLKIDFNSELKDLFVSGKKIKIIGNIPYNITSEILFKFFDNKEKIDVAVIMVQKELAHRLTAKPDTKDYGILAIQTQINSEPQIMFNVPPTAFFPKPKVHSAIVKLNFDKSGYKIADADLLKKLVRTSFGQRRKMMSNSLKELFVETKISFGDLKFDFSRRPENVSVREFIELANEIKRVHSQSGIGNEGY